MNFKQLCKKLEKTRIKPSPKGYYYVKCSPFLTDKEKQNLIDLKMLCSNDDPDVKAYYRLNKGKLHE